MASTFIKVSSGMHFVCNTDGVFQTHLSTVFVETHCKRGGFMIHRHNELQDFTASILTEVCHNVAIEPKLQPLDGETFQYRSANTDTEARLDVRACGFWN